MKIDSGLPMALPTSNSGGFSEIAAAAKEIEAGGYAGAWTAETSHDPFLEEGRHHGRDLRICHGVCTHIYIYILIYFCFVFVSIHFYLMGNVGYLLSKV